MTVISANSFPLGYEKVTNDPTGFENRTDSTITWSNAVPDRTFGILPAVTSYNVYLNGIKKTITDTKTFQIPNVAGFYIIYFNLTDWTLTASVTFPSFKDNIFIATVYWNGIEGFMGDERHGLSMDWNTHYFLHETIGSQYKSGLAGTFTNTTFQIALGYYFDEDIEHYIPAKTQTRHFYRSGSTWLATPLTTEPYYLTGGNLQYDNGGVLTPVPATDYVVYWFFATNDPTYPVISLLGQRIDGSRANARLNNTYSSLSFGTLPYKEMKVLYRVLFRNDATPYEEAEDYRQSNKITSGITTVTVHSGLSGLLDDDHTQYALLAGRSGGQTINGSSLASEGVALNSTSNSTKGTIAFDGWFRKTFPKVNSYTTISEAATLTLTANKSYFVKAYIVGKNNNTAVEGAYSFELTRSFYRNSLGTTITASGTEISISTSANPYSVTFTPSIEVKDASDIKVSITYSASTSPKDHYWEVTLMWKEI